MKKTIKYMTIILLFLFSIYYTDKTMDILKTKDPLMLEIKNNSSKYKVEPVNAIINDNTIIPGKNGQEVDIEKTYNQMRKYGTYNEGLTKIKETIPTISITNNYDKYIKLTNSDDKKLGLLFIINNQSNLNNIINILNNHNISATLYFEDNQIEKNIELIKNTTYEIEMLYPKKHLFSSTKSYLETLTDSELKYCYTEDENIELLEICQKNNMHTIIPSLVIKNNLYQKIKNKIETSPIISIYSNKYLEKELSAAIEYLKKKGYKFYELNSLISEDN